jgi:hypothetical protein
MSNAWRKGATMLLTEYQGGEAQDKTQIETLLARANESHLASQRAAGEAVGFATEAGKALQEIKDLVGHGNWRGWLSDNRERLKFSARTATDYIRLAKMSEANRQRAADLSIRATLKMLGAPEDSNPPNPTTPSPTLSEPYLVTMADAILRDVRADVLASHLRTLEQVNAVSADELDAAVEAWKRAEARR